MTPDKVLFDVDVSEAMPKLAWMVALTAAKPHVYCGKDVEVFDNGIVEGCWDGEFSEYGFDRAENVFGSGFVVNDGSLTFCTPSHTLDGLYVLMEKEQAYVANSLPLLFSLTSLSVCKNHNYTSKLITLINGIDKYAKLIYQAGDKSLYRILFDNFKISGRDISCQRKGNSGHITDFASYYEYLLKTLEACAENASDQLRQQKYKLLTTCSSGYDSNTCATLAVKLGCTEAITLKSSRQGDGDSGREVAEALGLHCTEMERLAIPQDQNLTELEFVSNGTGGGDFVHSVFEDQLAGKVCLTGYHGDKVWCPNVSPSAEIIRGDNSGCSLSEFRLRVGFVHIPVPFIAVRQHAQIHKISNSPEMDLYRVGGRYDRPICRRIVEGMGIGRSLFGQLKKAVTIGFIWGPRYLSVESRNDFKKFLKQNSLYLKSNLSLIIFHIGNYCYNFLARCHKRTAKAVPPIGSLFNTLKNILSQFRDFEGSLYCNYLFIWALERTMNNYKSQGIDESPFKISQRQD
jgi:hypothetical protein